MSNRASSSFGATDQRVYVVNNRVPVFDFNTEQIKLDLSNNVVPILNSINNELNNLTVGITGPISLTGSVSLAAGSLVGITGPVGITGAVSVSNFPTTQGITGAVSIMPNQQVKLSEGITGSVSVSNFPTTQGITGAVSIMPNQQIKLSEGITGSVSVSNFPTTQGITGAVSIMPNQQVKLSEGITGSVSVSNFPSTFGITGPVSVTGAVSVSNFPSTFGITGPVTVNINGVTGVNGRLPTYDASATYAINNHAIKAMIDDGEGNLTLQDLQGVISASGYHSLSVYNYDLDTKFHNDSTFTNAIETVVKNQVGITGAVSLSTGTTVGLTGPFVYGNFLGVTGSFATTTDISGQYVNISKLPPVSITGPVSLSTGTTVGLTGEFVYNGFLGVTGNFGTVTMGAITISGNQFVGITGTALVKDISANATLTLIESDISSGILVKGQDDTGTRYPIYVDVDGVQRTEIVSGHAETGKYIFETDATTIATGTSWGLDNRDREGWYFSGTSSSTLKWYGNNGISNPPSLEFNKMQAVWMIATLDDVTAAPKIRVVTSASTWDYTVPSPGVTIYNGEQYVFYYGTKAIALNPEYVPILLIRSLVSGPGANNEIISEINVVTGTSTNFLLNKTGIWDQYISQMYATVFRDIRAQTAEDNLISLDFSGTQLKTVATIDGPVSLASGTTVGLATDTLVAINAAFVGSGTPVYDNVNMVSTPYSTFAGLQTYANELTTAAHLRADLWDAGYTGSQFFQVRPSATVSATGPSGLQLISLSTTVDNKATNPANVTIIGGITGSVSLTGPITIATGTTVGITGFVGITGPITLASGTTVSLTGPIGITGIVSTNDISANTTLSAINTKMVQQYNTTNDGGTGAAAVIGLNTYSIYPKVLYYNMAGISQVADNNMLFGGYSSSRYFFSDFYGIANVKTWYAYSETNNRNITYEYVDASGNRGTATTNLVANTWKQLPLQSGSLGSFLINKWTTDVAFVGAVKLYIAYDAASTAKCMFGGDYLQTFNALFTVPVGYKAFITNINFDSNGATDYLVLLKWSATGVRSTVFYWSTLKQVTGNFNNEFGGAGGCFEAGETIGWATLNNASYKQFYATVMCRPV